MAPPNDALLYVNAQSITFKTEWSCAIQTHPCHKNVRLAKAQIVPIRCHGCHSQQLSDKIQQCQDIGAKNTGHRGIFWFPVDLAWKINRWFWDVLTNQSGGQGILLHRCYPAAMQCYWWCAVFWLTISNEIRRNILFWPHNNRNL